MNQFQTVFHSFTNAFGNNIKVFSAAGNHDVYIVDQFTDNPTLNLNK